MVAKAIINAIRGNKPKPRLFPEGTKKFTGKQSQTLLQETQVKIDEINAGKRNPIDIIKAPEFGAISAKDVSPILTPDNVKNIKVKPPKPSSKQDVDNYLTPEEDVLMRTELTGKEDDFLNFNKINTTDDVLQSINTLGRQISKQVKKRTGGVQTWKETNDFATLLGDNAETLTANLLKLRPGSPLNAAEIKAAKNFLISQHKKLTQLAKLMRTETGDNTKTALEFAQQHALTAQLTKIYKGAQTEIARALNILKEPTQDQAIRNIDLDNLNRKNILMNLGGKKQIEKIADAYLETPGLVNKVKLIEKGYGAKTSDALVEIFLNNILSGTLTFVKNIGGNWIYKVMEKTERKYASWRFGGKTVDSVAEFEDMAAAFGEHLATTNMWRAFSQKWNTKDVLKNPFRNMPGFDSKVSGTKFESPVNAFSADGFGASKDTVFGKFIDVTGTILTMDRIPYRVLQNTDNYFKHAAYQSELYALSFRETIKEVKLGNLELNKASDYLASLITNPDDIMTKAAYEAALRRTFQTPLSKRDDFLGDIASGIQDLKASKGFNPLSIFSSQYFTFMRTPTNIGGTVLERMPYPGKKTILRKYKSDLEAGGARAEMAKAKAAMGWAFMMTFVPLGYMSTFHGSDIDVRGRKKYQLSKADNRQPKSFRFHNFLSDEIKELTGLTGSKLQASLNGFEPAVLMASVAADVGHILANMQDNWSGWKNTHKEFYNFFTAYAISFGDNLANSTFFNGAGRLVDLISQLRMSEDTGEVLKQEGKKIASGLVPYTMFLQQFEDLGSKKIQTENYGLVNADDFRKLNIDFLSMLQKNVPGFENELNLDYDWLGLPSPKFSVISSMEENYINKEAIDIGYTPTKPRKKIQFTAFDTEYGAVNYGIDVRVKLTEDEYFIYLRETGTAIRKRLEKLLADPKYINSQDRTYKKELMAKEVDKAKSNVTKAIKSKNSPFYERIKAEAERIATKKWENNQRDLTNVIKQQEE